MEEIFSLVAPRPPRHYARASYSRPSRRTNATISSTPAPVLRLVKTNGLAPRWDFASRAITSSEAPTCGARSVLLITSRSDRVMPGPPLHGIFSPPATGGEHRAQPALLPQQERQHEHAAGVLGRCAGLGEGQQGAQRSQECALVQPSPENLASRHQQNVPRGPVHSWRIIPFLFQGNRK